MTIPAGYTQGPGGYFFFTDGSGPYAVDQAGNPILVTAASSSGYRSAAAITRPANTTPYSANDSFGGVLTFANIGPAGGHIMLTSLDLRYDVSAIPTGMTSFRLHLYTATPPSALADNAAWDLPSGDRSAYIGYAELGSPADLGATLFSQVDQANKHIKLADGSSSLFGYVVTAGGYTPAANSETAQVVARSVGL